MKLVLFFLIISVINLTISSNEKEFNFLTEKEIVYSKEIVNLDGDSFSDYIITTMPKEEFELMIGEKRWSASVKNVYIVICSEDRDDRVFKIDNTRFKFLSIKQYEQMADYYESSQLGRLKNFFFLSDFNRNGRTEVYLIEFGWEEQWLVGYEFDDNALKKIIDIDINGLYKYNFKNYDSDELTILRGYQYPGSQKTISAGVYEDWLTYLQYDSNLGVFVDIKTQKIETVRNDFY